MTSLEELQEKYLTQLQTHEKSRFLMGEVASQVLNNFGATGLTQLAQTSHRRVSTLKAEIAVWKLSALLEGRARLTWTHLSVLRGLPEDEREGWADQAEDSDWSPAELRRQIQINKNPESDPEKIVKRAEVHAEKLKKDIDEAADCGVLERVAERAESVAIYAKVKKNGV